MAADRVSGGRQEGRQIIVAPDAQGVAELAAERLLARLKGDRPRDAVCLTGGTGPLAHFDRLAAAPYRNASPWPRVHWFIGDETIEDYRKTPDVKSDSTTETYAALKLTIDNWRWAGVPFYLRTGKALAIKRTEVAIKFKQAPFAMFRDTPVDRLSQNYLVIGIEPTEGITLQFNTKVPGPTVSIDGVEMKFRYKDYFKAAPSTGYETLIYDCMIGDNILFQRADGVEAGWQAVQPFLEAWKKAGADGLVGYEAGSEGPVEADALLARDGHNWRKLT
jgi:glucose-6-phosphate 1-dehydrogenase